jgi:hypothetical protein
VRVIKEMISDSDKVFSSDYVCRTLLKYKLINEEQREEILRKRLDIKRKLEKVRAMRHTTASSKGRIISPITIVDVITSLELKRDRDPSKMVDEEIIFQALAKEWKTPYKKIDTRRLIP